eukprot:TRINITY_DN4876_c0_g1_i1.p1 TRINITY_DN4876_c0_g1~~TRINITY_DN4876_c0_g1_i1.p1  ORF type:complete len:331 (+),score=56.29 TRINITY_DN4876_c0_g1_i1:97-1089(+)
MGSQGVDLWTSQLPAGMPPVGLGLWKAGEGNTSAAVYEAINIGYRHLDSACDYGNEKEVGEGIRRAIQEGICERKDLWITSKLWNTYHRKEHAGLALQRTLDDLGLDYLDLYLIHFPIALKFVPFEERYPPEWTDTAGNVGVMQLDRVPYRETWEAMEDLQASGKTRHIGVCNLKCVMLMDILSYCRQKPAVNQVEMHVYLQQPELVNFCRENDIALTAFSPFGALSYIPMGMAAEAENCFKDAVIEEISTTKGQSPGQVCLRYLLQRGVSVVPKSVRPERLRENLDVFGFSLTDDEMTRIAALDRNRRFNDPGVFARGWGLPAGYPIFG